jgi:hypothetical protein
VPLWWGVEGGEYVETLYFFAENLKLLPQKVYKRKEGGKKGGEESGEEEEAKRKKKALILGVICPLATE